MPVPSSNPQHTQAVIAVLIAIAAGCCVIYWRIVLRVILVVILILAFYGAAAGIHGLSSLMAAQHHR